MKKDRSVLVSIVVGLASLALVVSATPITATTHATHAQVSSQTQSITGKIMSVEKSSFTLSVGSAITKEGTAQQTNEKSMKFDVDKNTTIDGKLQVGKTADVTYRESNGSYLALSVRVAP
jgi:hypothetical protein